MSELIEMDITTSMEPSSWSSEQKSNNAKGSSNGLKEKVMKREYELRAFTDRSLSYWWVILPILFYLTVVVGGIMTSISVGNVYAAFDSYCILNANFTMKDISSLRRKGLETSNIEIIQWGSKIDCEFSEYASVGCVLYAGVWIVMVLQCGRGGASRRGFRLPDAWRIVPPTCIGNVTVLIISAVILEKVTSGFKGFCDSIQFKPEFNNVSCIEILEYHFPWDKYNTDLVQEYEMSHIGTIIQFVGSLLGFIIVAFRCFLAPDFDVYERKQIGYYPANTDDPEGDQDEDEIFNRVPIQLGSVIKTTTVFCHNPTLLIDNDNDDQDFGSLTSQSELISKSSESQRT